MCSLYLGLNIRLYCFIKIINVSLFEAAKYGFIKILNILKDFMDLKYYSLNVLNLLYFMLLMLSMLLYRQD